MHKLVVARRYGGHGFARAMLDWTAHHAAANGYKFLRLDCAPRPKLLQVYSNAGFARVGEDMVVDGFLVARLQRVLTPSPTPPAPAPS